MRRLPVLIAVVIAVVASCAAQPHTTIHVPYTIRGAALEGDALYTWGDGLRRWVLPALRAAVLARGRFADGGCLLDFNGDGRIDVILQDGAPVGRLLWFEAPHWTRHVIDREIEMHDCLAAELFGRRGFLMIHRYSQVRFYQPGGVRDIYSIYTPSRQGGLALADVDADGRLDILCGNYWIRSPERFELPWRLFAINTISEQPDSALFRLAWNGMLVVSQGEMKPGRAVRFRKPGDPREQWPAIVLADGLAYPHGLLLRRDEIVVAENNGRRSRWFVFAPGGERRVESRGIPAHTMCIWGDSIVTAGPRNVTIWFAAYL
ncbi:MAG TPA: hypothetical protein VFL57_07660 [Bryobacteraceae bacterium]|nr:hypothetical protein [Bryobacteraceae bacterium]